MPLTFALESSTVTVGFPVAAEDKERARGVGPGDVIASADATGTSATIVAAKVRPLPDRCTPCAAARHSRTALRRQRNGRLSASAEQKAPVGAEVMNHVAGRVSDLASAVAGLEKVQMLNVTVPVSWCGRHGRVS